MVCTLRVWKKQYSEDFPGIVDQSFYVLRAENCGRRLQPELEGIFLWKGTVHLPNKNVQKIPSCIIKQYPLIMLHLCPCLNH